MRLLIVDDEGVELLRAKVSKADLRIKDDRDYENIPIDDLLDSIRSCFSGSSQTLEVSATMVRDGEGRFATFYPERIRENAITVLHN